jgi:hypothetical protein
MPATQRTAAAPLIPVLHIMDFLNLQLRQDDAAKLALDERNAVEKLMNARKASQ